MMLSSDSNQETTIADLMPPQPPAYTPPGRSGVPSTQLKDSDKKLFGDDASKSLSQACATFYGDIYPTIQETTKEHPLIELIHKKTKLLVEGFPERSEVWTEEILPIKKNNQGTFSTLERLKTQYLPELALTLLKHQAKLETKAASNPIFREKINQLIEHTNQLILNTEKQIQQLEEESCVKEVEGKKRAILEKETAIGVTALRKQIEEKENKTGKTVNASGLNFENVCRCHLEEIITLKENQQLIFNANLGTREYDALLVETDDNGNIIQVVAVWEFKRNMHDMAPAIAKIYNHLAKACSSKKPITITSCKDSSIKYTLREPKKALQQLVEGSGSDVHFITTKSKHSGDQLIMPWLQRYLIAKRLADYDLSNKETQLKQFKAIYGHLRTAENIMRNLYEDPRASNATVTFINQ